MFEAGELLNGAGRFNVRDAIQKMVLLPAATLDAEEATNFIEGVWDQTTIKNIAEKVTMKSQKKKLRHMGLTTRMLKPEAQFNTSSIITTLTDNEIELSTVEMRAGILIKDSDLEDVNIGSADQFKNTVMSIVMNKLANEIEEWMWISENTTALSDFGVDDVRSLVDGFRYQIDHSQSGGAWENTVTGSANILDASNTVTADLETFSITTTQGVIEFAAAEPWHPEFKLAAMMRHMPTQYWNLESDFRFFMNNRIWQRELDGERKLGTEIAHKSLAEGGGYTFDGIPVVQCPVIPLTMEIDGTEAQAEALVEATGDLTDVVLTPQNNLVFGIQLDLVREFERDAKSRGTNVLFTIRADVKVRDVNAVVFLKRVKNA